MLEGLARLAETAAVPDHHRRPARRAPPCCRELVDGPPLFRTTSFGDEIEVYRTRYDALVAAHAGAPAPDRCRPSAKRGRGRPPERLRSGRRGGAWLSLRIPARQPAPARHGAGRPVRGRRARVADAGRAIIGSESFEVNAAPGRDLLIVMRTAQVVPVTVLRPGGSGGEPLQFVESELDVTRRRSPGRARPLPPRGRVGRGHRAHPRRGPHAAAHAPRDDRPVTPPIVTGFTSSHFRTRRACEDGPLAPTCPRPGDRRRAGPRLLRGPSRGNRRSPPLATVLPRVPGPGAAGADPRRPARARRRLRRRRPARRPRSPPGAWESTCPAPRSRRAARPIPSPALAFQQGDGADPAVLKGLGGPFDVVLMVNVVTSLADVQGAFEAVASVCHARTRLFVYSYSRVWQPALRAAEMAGLKPRSARGGVAAPRGSAQHAPARGLRGRPARLPGRDARCTCRSSRTSRTGTWATSPASSSCRSCTGSSRGPPRISFRRGRGRR